MLFEMIFNLNEVREYADLIEFFAPAFEHE